MKKALLLINNFSGNSRRFTKNEKAIRQRLNSSYDIIREKHIEKGQTVDVNEESKDCEAVIVCGGDGTLNRTINYLKDRLHDIELVYIPTGTSNELGHRLKCDYSLQGKVAEYPLTVGFVDGRMFLDATVVGMFALTGPKTPPEQKHKFKRFAFFLHFFSEFRNWRINIKIENNRGISTEGTFSFFMLNTCGSALGIKLFKRNEIPQGCFVGIRAPRKKGVLGVINELYNIVCVMLKGFKKEYDNKRCVFTRFDDLKLTFTNRTEGALDGETFTFEPGTIDASARLGYFRLHYYKKV